MRQSTSSTLQWRAAFAAALLLSIGAFIGVTADRLWLAAFSAETSEPQVSVEALAEALSLNTRQTAEVSALVDSIGWAISEAIEQHPESLRVVAREARRRLENAVPFDRREGFRNWVDGRRSNMMDRMRGRDMMRGRRGGRGMREDGQDHRPRTRRPPPN